MKPLAGANCLPGPRIAVIGVTGSGKTTLAQELSQILDIPHIELDALYWLPNWQPADPPIFRQNVAEALSIPAWVTDGNYSKARDLIWSRATSLVWLDYPLTVILWQLTLRTIRRVITHEVLWNSNYETLRGAFFSRDSLFLWALKTHKRYRLEFERQLALAEYAHLQLFRMRSRRDTSAWLNMIHTANQSDQTDRKISSTNSSTL